MYANFTKILVKTCVNRYRINKINDDSVIYSFHGTMYDPVLVTVLYLSLVPWQPDTFPASWFINSLCDHVVFERFIDMG